MELSATCTPSTCSLTIMEKENPLDLNVTGAESFSNGTQVDILKRTPSDCLNEMIKEKGKGCNWKLLVDVIIILSCKLFSVSKRTLDF